MRKALLSTQLAKPAFKYSHLVQAGPHYYFSGLLAQDRQSGALVGASVGAQADRILENVQVLMQEFGLGSPRSMPHGRRCSTTSTPRRRRAPRSAWRRCR